MKIIGITETWLNDSNKDNFELDGYKFININRTNKRDGGVGLYIANELQYKTRNDLNINTEDVIETVFIEIEMPTGKNVIAGVIYRPPNSSLTLSCSWIKFKMYWTQLIRKTKFVI
jgi:exonuclease III